MTEKSRWMASDIPCQKGRRERVPWKFAVDQEADPLSDGGWILPERDRTVLGVAKLSEGAPPARVRRVEAWPSFRLWAGLGSRRRQCEQQG
jgi:hypothetical protein